METPNKSNNTSPNPHVIQEIRLDPLQSSSMPMPMFLDHEDDFPLIGQFSATQEIPMEWLIMTEIDQQGDDDFHDQVQQGAQGSSDAHENQECPVDHQPKVEEESSSKKLDHNAKERVRRLKLNTSYLALRSLLPDSRKPKEKWSAPYIIDRAIEYIPQVQDQIEKLTVLKSNIESVIHQQQQQHYKQTLTVSINEVKTGEIIIQICQHKDKLDHGFSTLIDKLQGEDIDVIAASYLCVSQHRSCFHLHLQMAGENPIEADYIADLHKKLISWLS